MVATSQRTFSDPIVHGAHSRADMYLNGGRIADRRLVTVYFGHAGPKSEPPAATHLLAFRSRASDEQSRDSVWPHTADMSARVAAFGRILLYAPPLRQSAACATYPGLHCANHQPVPVPTRTRINELKCSSHDGASKALVLGPNGSIGGAGSLLNAPLAPASTDTRSASAAQCGPAVPAKGASHMLAGVASNADLKRTIEVHVDSPYHGPQRNRRLGLQILNVMPPPGCGRTFGAMCIGDGFRFPPRKHGPSAAAEPFNPGAWKNTAQRSDAVRQEAPSVLLYGDVDAQVPPQNDELRHTVAATVSEWLARGHNCGGTDIGMFEDAHQPRRIDQTVFPAGSAVRVVSGAVLDNGAPLENLAINADRHLPGDSNDSEWLGQLTGTPAGCKNRLVATAAAPRTLVSGGFGIRLSQCCEAIRYAGPAPEKEAPVGHHAMRCDLDSRRLAVRTGWCSLLKPGTHRSSCQS